MMDKLAHDAYSQGAFDTLQSMDIPQHIKVAAAQELTKVALKGAGKKALDVILGANRGQGLTAAKRLETINKGRTSMQQPLTSLGNKTDLTLKAEREALKADQIRAALGLLGTGVAGTGITAGGMALMGEDEPVPVPAPTPAPPPPPRELSMMEQLGEYGDDFLARAKAGDLSNTELAALASAGVLGAGGIAYGLS